MFRLVLHPLCIVGLLIPLISCVFADRADARPPYKHALKKVYGARLSAGLHQCSTCHLSKADVDNGEDFDDENPPHNAFGDRLRELGESLPEDAPEQDIVSRLRQIAEEDSDLDGIANDLEILAGKNPGRETSRPNDQEMIAAHAAQQARQRESTGYAWEPFRPVRRPSVPTATDGTREQNPIDAFLFAEHRRLGLQASAEAARHVLLRRVYLDLVGVPPTRNQLIQFLEDTSDDAYEKVVDQLLASPLHGQRWGRHWMDIWRYSDWAGWTGGGQIRDSQPHIWRWRDWIIDSLNADRPYDEMVRAMLAADEISPLDTDDLRATGFLVRNYKMLSRETWMQDTVEHTSKAFLGLTLNCARCHDHMYDPITQVEYYQFRAFFEPYQVRADRLPGQPDVKVDGLARSFDADPQAKTQFFIKGDDRNPDKDREIVVGVPRLLGNNLFVHAVSLPPEAFYPGSLDHVRQQLLEASHAETNKAKTELAAAQQLVSDASKLVANAEATVAHRDQLELANKRQEVAQIAVDVAESTAISLATRIHADNARYQLSPQSRIDALAVQEIPVGSQMPSPAEAEHRANLLSSQLAAKRTELELLEAEIKAKEKADDPGLQAKVNEAKAKRDNAAMAYQQAQQKAVPGDYTPITEVHPRTSSGRRTALAQWMTATENPLLARVAVNHIWNRHFGRGLVSSVFDFGQNGKPPTHPALLDWLAAEFMKPEELSQAGLPWSMKRLHRLIVTSKTYRLSSQPTEEQNRLDPENEYLSRANTKRMEAELVRDAVLSVAGSLDLAMGGADIDYELGFKVPRRSLYFRHAAEKEMTFLKIFDAAEVTECYQRKSSIMPQQALAMINSELTIAQSRRLVRTLTNQGFLEPAFSTDGKWDESQVTAYLFERILSRRPTPDELATCVSFVKDASQRGTNGPGTLDLADLSQPSADPQLRAIEQLAHVLMNHHEFVSIY